MVAERQPSLYGGDLIAEAPPGSLIYLVESQTEVEALQAGGLVAGCAPIRDGWQDDYARELAGHQVVIIPSAGWPGSYGPVRTRAIASSIRQHAASVKVTSPPPCDGAATDAATYLKGHTVAEFQEWADEVPEREFPGRGRNAPAAAGDTDLAYSAPVAGAESEDLAAAGGAAWPDPMASEALYGLAGDVVRRIEPTTEADPVALLLNFLGYFGNCAGLNPRFQVEDTDHGLNLFIGIVGATSKSRKGTADKRVRRLFQLVAEEWAGQRVKSGLSSGEGLIWAVRDPMRSADPKTGEERVEDEGEGDKRLLIVESELATVLRRLEREGSSLSALMRNAWDRVHPLEALVSERSRAQARAAKHHISVIGHITKAELARYLTRTEAANGLGNRFIWACVRRARLLPRGAASPNLNDLVIRLHQVLQFAETLNNPVDFDSESASAWEAVYQPLSEGKPGLLGAMIARGEAHVVRLATAYAVLDLTPEIRLPHLLAALAVWDYSEASARYIFGEELGDADADDVLRALRESPDGLTTNELREHFSRHWDSKRTDRTLSSLSDQGIVGVGTEATGGRPAKRYRVTPAAARAAGESYLALAKSVGGRAVSAVSAVRADSNTNQGETLSLEGCAVSPGGQRTTGLSAQLPRTYGARPSLDYEAADGDTALTALTAQSPQDESSGGGATPEGAWQSAAPTAPADPTADQDHPGDVVPAETSASDPGVDRRLDPESSPDSAFGHGGAS